MCQNWQSVVDDEVPSVSQTSEFMYQNQTYVGCCQFLHVMCANVNCVCTLHIVHTRTLCTNYISITRW